jgi:hypothetical protein
MYVSTNGYKVMKSFLSHDEISGLQFLFDQGRKITQYSKKQLQSETLSNVYDRVEKLISEQADYNVNFSKLWCVKSNYENVDASKLPYLPHFDRIRFLKVMVYLTDTDRDSGAFFAAKSNVFKVELQRRNLPLNHKEQYLNDARGLGEFHPIDGKAGDAIIFDTNCPHYAGAVSKGKERRVLRFDYANPIWNSYWKSSFIERIISRASK